MFTHQNSQFRRYMIRALISFFLSLLSICYVIAGEYQGNKLLEVLGSEKNGEVVRKIKTQYLLDKSLKNPELGIKLASTFDSASVITAITLTAAGHEINDIKYKQFSGALPFDISFNDDVAALESKLGPGKTSDDDVRMKFKKDGITINVYFKSTSKKKIIYIKFAQSVGVIGPYRLDADHTAPVVAVAAPELPKKDPKTDSKPAAKPAAPAYVKPNSARMSQDPFYTSIMNVIESGEEEMFKDIKRESKPQANFWNYKYTYATSVSIPGEKYNMLYSFPFQSSQLDFVSVLEESNGPSEAIATKYSEVETKLKQFFKPADGWVYTYTTNAEDPKGIKDVEIKHPKIGSIVLDHSINPYGKHVLYLRFLLQYT
jgi:hypothetical protein